MTYLAAIHDYYAGQRIIAVTGVLAAAVILTLGVKAFRRRTDAGRTFAITTLLLAGLFMLPVNVVYFFYVGTQTEELVETLSSSQTEFVAAEQEHLGKMMAGFGRSYLIDTAAALLGGMAALVGLRFNRRKYAGAGLAVVLCALTLLAGEVWSKHRALHYQSIIRDAGNRGE